MSDARRPLPRLVILLGWISLLADIGSEMAYPVLPLFLAGPLAAPKAIVGLVEGLAQLVVSLTTAWAGVRSDRGHRTLFVRIGYALPSVGRVLIAMSGAWPLVLVGRSVDRLGKGLRTSPRDALLADAVEREDRGRAFGFHRMMDNTGAVLGVLLAIGLLAGGAFLTTAKDDTLLRLTLAASAVVSLGAAALAFALPREPERPAAQAMATTTPLPLRYWTGLAVLVAFALANSSDAFLLLRGSSLGLRPWELAIAYAAFCLVQALASMPLGGLSDRAGRWPVIAFGVALYALTYAGFAITDSVWVWAALLAAYGVSSAATDGVKRALVADHVPEGRRGTGLGIMHGATGVASLVASVAAGWLWDAYGPAAAFWFGSVAAVVALTALVTTTYRRG